MDPVWLCWQLHLDYLTILMQHQMSVSTIHRLDQLIQQHQRLFLEIHKDSPRFKPKHHFAQHFPMDILRLGPPRHYWTMRFEAMNQVFKRFATTGNYMDVCGRCAKFWCVKAAQASFKKSLSHWSETELLSSTPPCIYSRDSPRLPNIVMALFSTTTSMTLQVQSITAVSYQARSLHVGMWALLTLQSQPEEAGLFRVQAICACQSNVYVTLQLFPPLSHGLEGGPAFVRVREDADLPESVFDIRQITSFVELHLHSAETADSPLPTEGAGNGGSKRKRYAELDASSASSTPIIPAESILKFVPML
eukprot:2896735-Pleurochrysis_carterae.AAC.1